MGSSNFLRHPFWQTILVLITAWVLFRFGIVYLPPLIGIRSAPVPSSVQLQYLLTVLVGMLLYMSADATRWARFKAPINSVMIEPGLKWARAALLVLIPLLVGFVTYERVRPSVAAPPTLRSIHPAPPGQITFRGRSLTLAGLNNPLRSRGSLEEHYEEGKRVYYQNCMPCHGDHLDGNGHYAPALNPTPLSFQDIGTIAQLTESFVFWRIAKGGPGLPREGAPWNSAMPAWEDILTEDEVWSVIIFLYEQTGHTPRTWEEEAGHEQ
ncbi:MAG: c-type cytochrome [Longimicrobiales bacterium]